MNDRILEALKAAGLGTSPLGVLDHASAQANTFFALYDSELVYHEGTQTSRVNLRDVTRIHSDREGVLRVETSEKTAVTASLLGYDPGRVQTFFQQVRDVTARAKDLPVVPLNQARPGVNSLPASPTPSVPTPPDSASMPGISAYTPAVAPTAPVTVIPAAVGAATLSSATTPVQPVGAPALPAQPTVQPSTFQPDPTSPSSAPAVQTPVQMPPAPTQPPVSTFSARPADLNKPAPLTPVMAGAAPSPAAQGNPLTVNSQPPRREAPRPEPVVISSMPPVSDPLSAGNRKPPRVGVLAEAPEAAISSGAHSQGTLVSVPVPSALGDGAGALSEGTDLLRRADTVLAFARTVGLLAIVLGVAALGVAYFQWQANNTLSGLWTLLAGGVGTVALLAFAEALRLLSALARTQLPSTQPSSAQRS
jgi:hypothetical protein